MAAGRWRRFVVRPFVWLLVLVALALAGLKLFLGSGLARDRARQFLEARLTDALARPVRIESVEFELLPLELVVEGLEIASDRRDEPPLVRLQRAEISADLTAIRLGALELRHVALQGLELVLQLRADGTDNVPRPPRSRGAGGEVRIGGLAIQDSTVVLREARLPLDLEAQAVLARFASPDGSALDGSVTAQSVNLVLPDATPWLCAVSARVRVDSGGLRIMRARVAGQELELTASGTVDWQNGTTVDLATRVETSGAWLDDRGWLRGEVAGDVGFDGRFRWQGGSWSAVGELSSARLAVIDFALIDLKGTVAVDRERARLELEQARWAGGALGGSFEIGLARPYPAEVDLVVAGATLDDALARFSVPVQGLRGHLSGPFAYRFDLTAADRGRGAGEFAIGIDELGSEHRPVDGQMAIALADGGIHLGPFRWHAGGQTAAGEGDYDLASGRGQIDLQVSSEDLGGLVALLPMVERGALWAPTAGTGQLDLRVSLEAAHATVEGTFAGAAVEAPGLRAQRVDGRLRLGPERLELTSLDLTNAANGTLRLAGAIPLVEQGALDLELTLDEWPIEEAAPWLPFALPLSGPARGSLRLAGTLETITGDGSIVISPTAVGGLAARRLAAEFDWDAERLAVAAGRLDFDAGGVEVSGALDFATEALEFSITSPSLALDAAPLSTFGEGALAGTLTLDARLGGTLSKPTLSVRAAGHGATLAGRRLPGEGEPSLTLDWRENRLDSTIDLPGVARLTGGGALELGVPSRLRFELVTERLAELATIATGGQQVELLGGVDAGLEVEIAADGALAARLKAPALAFRWQGREIRNLEPVVVDFRAGELRLESLYLASADGVDEIFVGGRLASGEPGEPTKLDLHIQADLGAEWLGPLAGDFDLAGRITVLATVRGTPAAPELSGEAALSQGRWIPPVIPHAFEQATALVLLYPNAVVLDELSSDFAGGRVTASGRLAFADGNDPTYRFEVAGRGLEPRWPAGWQLRGDADLTLSSTSSGRLLAGQILFDRAYYLQDIRLSPAQLVQRLLVRSRVVVPETDELLSSTALNLGIVAPGSLRVRNNLAELSASADLVVRGSLARPVLFGEIEAAPGGKATYAGNTYDLERAVVAFANPARIDPYLDVVARTRIEAYLVTLNIAGALSRPITAFSSDPPLPDLEILGLLATGAPVGSPVFTNVATGGVASSRSVAAEALLYGQAASLVSERVGKLFGFDRVRVEPLTSEDAVASARVTVGKRLSSRVFVTYSYDPASTAQDIFRVEWRLGQKLMLVLTQNGDESYAVDAQWENRF